MTATVNVVIIKIKTDPSDTDAVLEQIDTLVGDVDGDFEVISAGLERA